MLEIPRFVLGAKREGEKCSRSGSKQGSAFFFERFLKNTETKPQGSVLRTQVCVLCDASGDAVRATAAWTKSDGLTQRGFCQAGLVSELVAQDVRIFKLGRALQLFFSLSSPSRLRVNAPRDSGYDSVYLRSKARRIFSCLILGFGVSTFVVQRRKRKAGARHRPLETLDES